MRLCSIVRLFLRWMRRLGTLMQICIRAVAHELAASLHRSLLLVRTQSESASMALENMQGSQCCSCGGVTCHGVAAAVHTVLTPCICAVSGAALGTQKIKYPHDHSFAALSARPGAVRNAECTRLGCSARWTYACPSQRVYASGHPGMTYMQT